MLKTKTNKALLSVVIMLAVVLVAFIVLGTLAYYNAQRKAKGSTIFDNGIFLTLTNVSAESTTNVISGKLLYYPSGVRNSETQIFNVNKVSPSSSFIIAAPQIKVEDKSIDFYARLKLDVKYYEMGSDSSFTEVTASTFGVTEDELKTEMFESVLEFSPNWQELSGDGYYYYTSTTTNKIQKIVAGQTVDVLSSDEIKFNNFDVLNAGPYGIDRVEFKLNLEVIDVAAFGIAPGWNEEMFYQALQLSQMGYTKDDANKTLTINRNYSGLMEYKINPTYLIGDEEYTVIGVTGTNASIPFDAYVKNIYLPDTLKTIGQYAFYKNYNLTNIEIPDSVESIGEQAFYFCSALETVKFSDNLQTIGYRAFAVASIYEIDLPASLIEVKEAAFMSCGNLAMATFRGSVQTLEKDTFLGTSMLTSIKFCGTTPPVNLGTNSIFTIYVSKVIVPMGCTADYRTRLTAYNSSWGSSVSIVEN